MATFEGEIWMPKLKLRKMKSDAYIRVDIRIKKWIIFVL